MDLSATAVRILDQLADMVDQISPQDFSRPSQTLGGSSIGKHVRHTLEFFFCFEAGCSAGIVNYDCRAHDAFLERDKVLAREAIQRINAFLSGLKANSIIQLEVGYGMETGKGERVETSAMRELVYNIEHAVHHMAIIRIALPEVAPYLRVEENFGIAASTIRHHISVASSAHQ